MNKNLINGMILGLGIIVGIGTANKLDFLRDIKVNDILNTPKNYAEDSEYTEYFKEKKQDNLVLIESIYTGFDIDLKYATKNNITKEVLYDKNLAYLQKNTLDKLIQANEELRLKGYKIKIWDAYRPLSVQKKLWAILPNANYIANPFIGGSNHNRGAAVDITLVDLEGNEVHMPTKFDDFTPKAHRDTKWDKEARKNVEMLTEVMEKNGFSKINTEWWHFDDIDYKDYEIKDYTFRELSKK